MPYSPQEQARIKRMLDQLNGRVPPAPPPPVVPYGGAGCGCRVVQGHRCPIHPPGTPPPSFADVLETRHPDCRCYADASGCGMRHPGWDEPVFG